MSNNTKPSARALTLAELHTHSTASDGQHDPVVLASMCREHGVELWSLTDHDTLSGCAEAARAAEAAGVEFLPGVEISARLDRSIHVLGYGLDPTDEELEAFFTERRELRETRMERMVMRAVELGLGVTMEDVQRIAGDGNLARPHLARALVARGHAESVQDAFDRYLDEGQPCYIPSPYVSVPEAIAFIHEHGGVAVLAHPGQYDRDEAIAGWVELGLDGIEISHPAHSQEDRERYRAIAEEHGLLMLESSDYHGEEVAPERVFGVTQVPTGWIDALRERLAERAS